MLTLEIEARLRVAVNAVLPDADTGCVLVRPSADVRFGDYQCNALIQLARASGMAPRQLATEVSARLDVEDLCEAVDVAGPGFLNFRLRPEAVANWLSGELARARLTPTRSPRTVVIDFSSPNVAKPMHVGHIRSTVLGDSLARTFRLLGHRVITDNHIGDWGTQFGMLLLGWKEDLDVEALEHDPLTELERIYKGVNQRCRESEEVMGRARSELVRLQGGDPENMAIWKEMLRLSNVQFESIYQRLGVRFDYVLGESSYNPWLADVVEGLLTSGIARESGGAIAVFTDGKADPKADPFLVQRDGTWQDNPMLIRKSDGGFNYATTDLATLDYRMRTWNPDEIIYVTDGRQQLHFRQVFETFRRWQPEIAGRVRISHVWFGSILGDDGRPFKTRSGETIRLAELLDEAEERALAVVAEKRGDLNLEQQREIARVVGLGAVKYQDLIPNRQSDYVFSWDKMLALQGNTAPYLQYQYTRAAKVVRDGNWQSPGAPIQLTEADPSELALAKRLLDFPLILEMITQEHRPNLLCNYLYEVAGAYSRFYEACPVLRSEAAVRESRLSLCEATARTLKRGLDCLGIEVSEIM